MKRNVWIVLAVAILFGLGLGVYEFALPYYLDAHGVSIPNMGYIYAIGALFVFVLRIYAGHLSDIFGRKMLYSASFALTSAVSLLTPVSPKLWFQAPLKSLREVGRWVYDSMFQLALFDEKTGRYADLMARSRGLQSVAEAAAIFGTGLLLAREAYTQSFQIAAGVLALGFIIVVFGYHPQKLSINTDDVNLKELLSYRLPRPLIVLTITAFVFTIGLAVSHCFVMQLFWERKFAAPRESIGVILMLHRLTIALPLLFLSWSAKRKLKQTYIAFVFIEGLIIIAGGIIPNLYWAAGIWLLHDLLGAGVWLPIQSTLIQRYSRDESRGSDVSKVFAVASLGWIIGPLIAGAVFDHWYGGPFVISGIIMILAGCVLFALPTDEVQSEPGAA